MSTGKQDKMTGVFRAKGQPQNISRGTGKPAALVIRVVVMYWLLISRNLKFVLLLTAMRRHMKIRKDAYLLRMERRKEAEAALEQQRRDAAHALGISYGSYMARFIHLKAGY